jgi:hypothetical protein
VRTRTQTIGLVLAAALAFPPPHARCEPADSAAPKGAGADRLDRAAVLLELPGAPFCVSATNVN